MEYQSVAVVDASADAIIVWQVDVSSDPSGLSRMSGAWVLAATDSTTLRSLTEARYLAATRAGLGACRRARASGYTARIDLSLTLTQVSDEVDRLQKMFEQAVAGWKSTLVPPAWPTLPRCIDADKPPVDRDAPGDVLFALEIARWLEAVALAWEVVEQQRLMRKQLRGEHESYRKLPLATAE
ncbi:MAG: hypothetical protein HZB45_24590 [Mycolicibacterium rufum]|uniref:hypothetical protein n=1 Tax=Mycolicibacterium chlorophenolicum TaxID=37916 RepID=UPI000766FC2E|nr:hypothetical protein [Mycolicibacterium chlorophenolicum]MBI5340873.1 hypothetical protein [Mycolicibacterium rufum]